ncbi:MAG: hypothetical protein OXE17_04790 [Chloroflexi bacterium]|nr:hypothetical protein [Chloroflexota bacterium]
MPNNPELPVPAPVLFESFGSLPLVQFPCSDCHVWVPIAVIGSKYASIENTPGLSPNGRQRDWVDTLARDTDIELVEAADGTIDALLKAGSTEATVVVVDLPESGQDPGLTGHLLDEYPHIKVVAVSEDGRNALKYEAGIIKEALGDPSVHPLKELFRSLWKGRDQILRK